MFVALAQGGANISAVYGCPHYTDVGGSTCKCRKPKPGMILDALERYNLDPEARVMIGDNLTDIEAANSAGIYNTILIDPSGHFRSGSKRYPLSFSESLAACCELLI